MRLSRGWTLGNVSVLPECSEPFLAFPPHSLFPPPTAWRIQNPEPSLAAWSFNLPSTLGPPGPLLAPTHGSLILVVLIPSSEQTMVLMEAPSQEHPAQVPSEDPNSKKSPSSSLWLRKRFCCSAYNVSTLSPWKEENTDSQDTRTTKYRQGPHPLMRMMVRGPP